MFPLSPTAFPLRGGIRVGGRARGPAIIHEILMRLLSELGLSTAGITQHVGVITSRIAKVVARLEEEGGP